VPSGRWLGLSLCLRRRLNEGGCLGRRRGGGVVVTGFLDLFLSVRSMMSRRFKVKYGS
jgi:hypothetical protein